MNWHDIGKRIHTRRKELKMTLAALGESVGRKKTDRKKVSHVTIRNWESGAEIKKDNFDALAKALSVSIAWLETGTEQPGLVREDPNAYIIQAREVPLIDMVAAGDWSECVDPYPVGHGVETRLCPVRHGDNTFAVRINGESMMPRFRHGEIIFCDPGQQPNNGDFIIAKLTDDNQATFKQLIIEDGKHFLKAINPDWPNQFIEINGNCHIVGKVIAKIETF
jgi:SOS-response transcriptional repressor LexA